MSSAPFSPTATLEPRTAGAAIAKEPAIEQGREFTELTRTGQWFAMGDANAYVVPPSLLPPPLVEPVQGSRTRRVLVRLVGGATVGGTLVFLLRMASHAPARQAVLGWVVSAPTLATLAFVALLGVVHLIWRRRGHPR